MKPQYELPEAALTGYRAREERRSLACGYPGSNIG